MGCDLLASLLFLLRDALHLRGVLFWFHFYLEAGRECVISKVDEVGSNGLVGIFFIVMVAA